jgi:integrase
VRFHDLRHSVATVLLVAGVDLKVVSQLLGHSSIAITADIYAHVLPEQQRAVVDKWMIYLSINEFCSKKVI